MGARQTPPYVIPDGERMHLMGLGRPIEAVGQVLERRDSELVHLLGETMLNFVDPQVSIFNPQNLEGTVANRVYGVAQKVGQLLRR